MTVSESNNELAEDLAKSLQATTTIMQTLLSELQGNATTLAVLKEKFDSLGIKVQSLSKLITDDNGNKSVVTRLALIEKRLIDIETDFNVLGDKFEEEDKDIHRRISSVKALVDDEIKTESVFRKEKILGWFKLAGSVIPGLVALGIVLVKLFMVAE